MKPLNFTPDTEQSSTPAAGIGMGTTAVPGGIGMSTTAFGAKPGGFGAPTAGAFGATAAQPQQQQQQQSQAGDGTEILKAQALDRLKQFRYYTTMKRFPEPEKDRMMEGMGAKRVQNYIKRRLRELGEGRELLAYVWDGGSSDYYQSKISGADQYNQQSFNVYRPTGAANATVGAETRDQSMDKLRDSRVWPQHDMVQGQGIAFNPKALPTDTELLMHVICTFLDHRLRPQVKPKQASSKPAQATTGAFGSTTMGGTLGGLGQPSLGGAFGMAKPAMGTMTTAPANQQPAAPAAPQQVKEGMWFTSEHFLPANVDRPRRPVRGISSATPADMSKTLKSKPFLEERLALDPDIPQMLCPQYVIYVAAKKPQAMGVAHSEPSQIGDRALPIEVQPGPDNLYQALAVLAMEVKLYYKGKLGMLDLSHPSLNLISFIPDIE